MWRAVDAKPRVEKALQLFDVVSLMLPPPAVWIWMCCAQRRVCFRPHFLAADIELQPPVFLYVTLSVWLLKEVGSGCSFWGTQCWCCAGWLVLLTESHCWSSHVSLSFIPSSVKLLEWFTRRSSNCEITWCLLHSLPLVILFLSLCISWFLWPGFLFPQAVSEAYLSLLCTGGSIWVQLQELWCPGMMMCVPWGCLALQLP